MPPVLLTTTLVRTTLAQHSAFTLTTHTPRPAPGLGGRTRLSCTDLIAERKLSFGNQALKTKLL